MLQYMQLLSILLHYRTREHFLSYVRHSHVFSLDEQEQIISTYASMEKQFAGVRRESGGPYMDHLRSVATVSMIHLGVTDVEEILAALLHDVVEHFPEVWPRARIETLYGDRVASLVDTLSKPPVVLISGESEAHYQGRLTERNRKYHERFKTAERAAVRLKMSDWMHNILTLIYCPRDKQERKRLEALEYALPRAIEYQVLSCELWTALNAPVLFPLSWMPDPVSRLFAPP